MRLYLLRHGTAERRRGGQDDPRRELLAKGRGQCRKVARLLKKTRALPEVVLTSPYLRAKSTAEQVIAALGQPIPLRLEERLRPSARVSEAVAAVLETELEQVLAVGHEPLLSQIAASLAGAPRLRVDLRKGGMVELELEPGPPPRGILLGLLRPGHL